MKQNCGSCAWYEDFQGVCFNGDSPRCADFTEPDTTCPAWEGKRSLRRPVAGHVVYIHPKGYYHTVEFELNGGHVRESFKGVSD